MAELKPGREAVGERRYAVLGAGLSGLTAARTLQAQGVRVKVFEKARGVGGRLATRRLSSEAGAKECYADFGAQFFSAFSDPFQIVTKRWLDSGLVRPWFEKAGSPRYMAPLGMTALAKDFASGLEVQLSTRVVGLEVTPQGRYQLRGVNEPTDPDASVHDLGDFDGLILSAPLPQSRELIATLGSSVRSDWVESMPALTYDPCLAWMGVFRAEQVQLVSPGFVEHSTPATAWIASSRLKGLPVSPGYDVLTVHLSAQASLTHWSEEAHVWESFVLNELKGHGLLSRAALPLTSSTQRWRYSQPNPCVNERSWAVPIAGARFPLQLCGDGFGGPRVEGAYLSGLEAAKSVFRLQGMAESP